MPESLCLITLGSVIMHIKFVSFLNSIVSSCIAEFDLFKFTCITLIADLPVFFVSFLQVLLSALEPRTTSRGAEYASPRPPNGSQRYVLPVFVMNWMSSYTCFFSYSWYAFYLCVVS